MRAATAELILAGILVAACVATPDVEYAPAESGDASDTDAPADAATAPASAPHGHDAALPKACAKKDQRCTTAADCCSGRCEERDDVLTCG